MKRRITTRRGGWPAVRHLAWPYLALSLVLGVAPARGVDSGVSRAVPAGAVFNIIDWDSADLPPVYERSAQLPLSLAEVIRMSAADFGTEAIVKMIQERRCACDASVASLVKLKEAGVSQAVIQAVSLHALPPNQHLDFVIQTDFEGRGGAAGVSTRARKAYLYVVIPDGNRDRVFFGNLAEVLARSAPTATEATDLLLPRPVRRASFAARVPLKVPGRKRALVFTSTRPDIYTEADIPETDRKGAQEFLFDYPASSLQSRCILQVLHRQDNMLDDIWHLERSHFDCEWN